MASKNNSQKFIGRNRPPRVQIEFDLETYGQTGRKELPFVVGVLSDLSGKSKKALADLEDRKFTKIDANTFDEYLADVKPRVEFNAENTLSEGYLPVDLEFSSLKYFEPDAIANKVQELKVLMDKRKELKELKSKINTSAAEKSLNNILNNKDLLQSLINDSNNKSE